MDYNDTDTVQSKLIDNIHTYEQAIQLTGK